MNNRVYYGEYSLQHWIDLIISQNIQLPPYQRTFVWKEEDVYKLYKSFKEHYFVPPVTIGAFNKNENNYILDGQQRLTSLILLLLGYFPVEEAFKSSETEYAGNDEESSTTVYTWTLKNLLDSNTITVEKIKSSIASSDNLSKYKPLKNAGDIEITDEFLKTTYLGFSYIVPDKEATEAEQTKFYSTVFRSINNSGVHLRKSESRSALYFLSPKKHKFFDPDFLTNYIISKQNGKSRLDFVRYLSIISNYKKTSSIDNIGVAANAIEDFYDDYIHNTLTNEESNQFPKFTELFPNGKFLDRMEHLKNVLENMNFEKEYKTIIHMDLVFFGLINKVFFNFETIDESQFDVIKQNIEKAFEKIKKTQVKNSGNPSYLRERFKISLEIYEGTYVIGE